MQSKADHKCTVHVFDHRQSVFCLSSLMSVDVRTTCIAGNKGYFGCPQMPCFCTIQPLESGHLQQVREVPWCIFMQSKAAHIRLKFIVSELCCVTLC